ncbi:hypothetical protein BJX63DRAFT_441254 [Aspergillus granulosus]|uniref:Uncharacterized protein n=1 Tax=Aspergillus granulosus TaxID=176169 RepID=A0ABR4I4I5_9EURO
MAKQSWEVEVCPRQTFQSNGTVEEVYSRLVENHPEWEEEYFKPSLARLADNSALALLKRTDFYNDGWVVCGQLVPGRPGNGPGPGNRGRVSCGYNAAIWWCNDGPQSQQLEFYDSIADGADALMSCVTSIGWYDQVAGQAFHKTNWNVIVCGDSC